MACKIAYPFPTHCCDPRQSASVLKIKAVVLLLLILSNDRAYNQYYYMYCKFLAIFLPAFNILTHAMNTPLITLTVLLTSAWLSNTKIVHITYITSWAIWNKL